MGLGSSIRSATVYGAVAMDLISLICEGIFLNTSKPLELGVCLINLY